jgi:uncharacterized protein (TIGR02996 family)
MSASPQEMEQAFLASIVAQPEDPSTWLILADWLEDQSDPRAELVRLTWSLQHDTTHSAFAQRQQRVQGLLASGVQPVVPRLHLSGFDFVWIPPGSFRIGSPPDEASRDDDETQHVVHIAPGFWMGAYPVTQGQWMTLMEQNPSDFSASSNSFRHITQLSEEERLRLPVEKVNSEEAAQFAARVNWLVGRPVGLPTEAQWEYACRAGTTTVFPFGNVLDGTQANCQGSFPYGTKSRGPYLSRTTPVGSYPPNAWGLYDMIGNVGEWTRDTFRPDYEALPARNPVWEEESPRRVVFRGGSWDRNPIYCRAAYRNHIGAQARTNNIGFRLVLR